MRWKKIVSDADKQSKKLCCPYHGKIMRILDKSAIVTEPNLINQTLAGGYVSSPFNSSSLLKDLGPGIGRACRSGAEVNVFLSAIIVSQYMVMAVDWVQRRDVEALAKALRWA